MKNSLIVFLRAAVAAVLISLSFVSHAGAGPANVIDLDSGEKVRLLSAGPNSSVGESFVFVVRTRGALEELGRIVALPEGASDTDFNKAAIVAAFSGTKPTGGFSVGIGMIDGELTIAEESPGSDDIVTQALSQPYAIAVVDVEEEDSLFVNVPESWAGRLETYSIRSGRLNITGGFIGIDKTVALAGTVKVMRFGGLATFQFEHLESADGERKLAETVSGHRSGEGWIAERMEAGKFVERPHPPLRFFAALAGDSLDLKFEPGKRDYVVNDGYEASGELTAKRVVRLRCK